MAREEAETVSKGWRFKGRHHVHTDSTRRMPETVSKEWSFKQRLPHAQTTHAKRPKPQQGWCFKNDTAYSLMACEEAETVRQGVVLQRATPRTGLMAREEPETVSKGWRYKERRQVQAGDTRKRRNCEQGVVLPRTRPHTY